MVVRIILRVMSLALLVCLVGSSQITNWSRAWTTIFSGVRHAGESLAPGPEGRGLIHFVEVDLSNPGIELFVTPLDSEAVAEGWEYRLSYLPRVIRDERLAVAINANLFTSRPRWRPQFAGDYARSVETLVADHAVNHVWEHTYLLAFDDRHGAWFTLSKPPKALDLARARWAVGGQAIGLHEGRVWPGAERLPDARTAVALDRTGRLLYLAVAENISPHLLLTKLSERGAATGMLLDGGHSTTLAVGAGAMGIGPGVVLGGWRPVATVFGIRARRLER